MFVVYNKKTGLIVDRKNTLDEAALEAKKRNDLRYASVRRDSIKECAFCSENTFIQLKNGVGNWRGARTVC